MKWSIERLWLKSELVFRFILSFSFLVNGMSCANIFQLCHLVFCLFFQNFETFQVTMKLGLLSQNFSKHRQKWLILIISSCLRPLLTMEQTYGMSFHLMSVGFMMVRTSNESFHIILSHIFSLKFKSMILQQIACFQWNKLPLLMTLGKFARHW